MTDERKGDPIPRYVAPLAAAAVPVGEPEPADDALREMERAAVPATASALIDDGQLVITADGFDLGRVKETSETHFKVDAPLRLDYWLARDDIAMVRNGVVVMRFDEADLQAHLVAHPAPGDALLSPSEQLEQRRAMEAELESQRHTI